MAQAAGEVKIILAVDGASYSAALEKAKTQLKQLENSVGDAGKKTRAEMHEATASIALFGEEFGVHLPRHVRSFVASLPGVASAMSAAFSGAAILAIGMALVETGKKVYEFIQKTEEAARKNAEAWRQIQAPIEVANDELAVTNDKLENAIAKLEHKPENGMKEAIDEAILSADKLGEKLTADQEKIVATIKAQEVSFLGQAFGAKQGTADITERSEALKQALDEADIEGRARLKALHDGKATQEEIDAATRELNDKRKQLIDDQLKWVTGEITTAKQLQKAWTAAGPAGQILGATMGAVNPKDRLALLTGYAGSLGAQSDFITGTETNIGLKGRQATDAAAAANLAAMKEANAKRMEEWRRQLAEVEALTDLSKQDEANYWRGLAEAIRNNAPLVQSAMDEANRAQIAANKQYSENLMKGWLADSQAFERKKSDDERIHNEVMAAFDANQRDQDEGTRAQRQGARDTFAAAAEEIDAAMREGEETIRATRGLSRLDAAQALQQLHAGGAAALQQAFGTAQNAGAVFSLRDAEKLTAAADKQEQAGNAAVESATALGALKDAAAELAVRFSDMPAAIHEAVAGIIGTTNDALMSTLTDRYHRGNWREAGRRIFAGVTQTGLQAAEGSLLKLIPGVSAKLGENFTNPVHTLTKLVDTAAPGAGGAGNWATAAFPAAAGAGGALAKVAGVVADLFLPHLAEGGPMTTGMPAIVGEQGPELFIPAGAGRIVPNAAAGALGGTTHVWNIDARGANDPAATRFAVQRGILEAAPRIAAGSIAAQREMATRRPTMSR
jgi:hypothetical protein